MADTGGGPGGEATPPPVGSDSGGGGSSSAAPPAGASPSKPRGSTTIGTTAVPAASGGGPPTAKPASAPAAAVDGGSGSAAPKKLGASTTVGRTAAAPSAPAGGAAAAAAAAAAREFRLFRPSAANPQSDIRALSKALAAAPDIAPTAGELRVAAASLSAAASTGGPLLTRKHREEAAAARAARFPRVLIRLRLPDRSMLQGVFTPSSTVGEVRAFLAAHLLPGVRAVLFVTPPKKVLTKDRVTLWEEGLVPAAVVWVGVEGGEAQDGAALLKPETLAAAEDLPPPAAGLAAVAEQPVDKGKGKAVKGKAKAALLKGLSRR